MCTRRLSHLAFRLKSLSLGIALLLGLLFSAVPFQGVQAATLTVTNTNDSGPGSLRQAISKATSGSTIIFDPGLNGQTIPLTGGALIIQKRVTIAGPGADLLRISGNHKSRVFIVDAMAVVTISGLTIADGYVKNLRGGGINNVGNLTLDHTLVTGNELNGMALGGAGIYNGKTLKIRFSAIQGNHDRTYSLGGGGIYNDGSLSLEDSLVANNQVHSTSLTGVYGGGGICNRGTAVITRSVISANQASNYSYGGGGGIYNSGSMTLTHSLVDANTAPGTFGGGLMNWIDAVGIVDTTTFTGNQAGRDGGAIENAGSLTLTNSTLAGNHANGPEYGGGGIDNTEGVLNGTNNTISANSAVSHGGGLLNYDGSVTLTYTTLSGNTAAGGGGIYSMGDAAVTTTNLVNTLVAYSTGGDCLNLSGAVNNLNTLIADNSCAPTFAGDPLLGPLQNNGGETQTQALLPGSPAVDQAVCTDILFDQAGFARPYDFPEIPNWLDGGGCDLGAVELQGAAP